MTASTDPITAQVIRNALSSIADEMALVIMRTAHSAIVRDSMDYSTGLCDREGRVIAHGMTMALHLGSFPDAMQKLVAKTRDDTRPGDIFVFNDPYVAGGMHLPDVYIVKPMFVAGELEGYACSLVHQTDMGGLAPGSTAVYAQEIYQEGVRIPILKLYDQGQPNETFFEIMALNNRLPEMVSGDMRSQIAAVTNADRAFVRLLEKYGSATFRAFVEEMHDRSEAMMREEIAKIPDGDYSFTDFVDGLGETPEEIVLQLTLRVAGDEITIDWTGTSGEVKGAINCPIPFTKAAGYMAIKCVLDSDIPNFEGFTRPIKTIAPEGCIVNPRPPAACAARALMGWRMLDTLFGALGRILPDNTPAAGEGGVTFPVIAGRHNGQAFVCTETLAGAGGALNWRDGEHGIPNPGGNGTNQPVEMIEAQFPVLITRYGLVQNSGGPGKYRGAPAFVREYRLLADDAGLIMRSDRRRHLPYGVDGGYPGTPCYNILNPGPDQQVLPVMPMIQVPIQSGDIFCHISAGGAGNGDPLDRDPELVAQDVYLDILTTDYVADVYGVILTAEGAVDAAATEAKRAELAAARAAMSGPDTGYLSHYLAPLNLGQPVIEDERLFSCSPLAAE
ncbi:hydantoinase B/oxoprolinase family protein [Pseudodonghicola flavimaris]|uniref:Hydantoinase B/oxoprolinase family protein n=1 Tax=Pseudodonghicola flavimaris TaxID=3050036 RepID=A0ABT7F2N5_9RHOB|nr:hydantoinase B/oxoprolinase family protein [Pseudodonghicola flavimaris]MDK3018755.1 hydantoinase B/oxoprolinase family protein [Pseudodonghicola flavimaris]